MRSAVNDPLLDGDEEMAHPLAMTERDRLLVDLRTEMQLRMSTDLFGLLASVLRARAGRVQQKTDNLFDQLLRAKERHIFVFSIFGLATSIATATAFWYFGDRQHTTLPEVTQNQLYLLYFLQFILTISTVVTVILIVQKYMLLLQDKRREWSGVDMYDLVQAKDNMAVHDKHRRSYNFWRSSLSWKMGMEIGIHTLHPLIWMNTDATNRMYEAFQIMIFARLYLVVNLIYHFSEQYRGRREIVASNVELQRTGFQLTVGSTLKMKFYDQPAVWTLCVMIGSLMILGFIVFVVERSLNDPDNSFRDVQSSLWFAFVTFSTVGYGDMSPKTAFGRLASVAIGIVGITTTTIFGGVVTNLMVQSREQRQVSDYLARGEARDQYRDSAARVIQMAFRYTRRKNRDIVAPWQKAGHKSNVVYAAIKDFRSHRWRMSQSHSTANDPVTDTKMNSVSVNLRHTVHRMRQHGKTMRATENNVKTFVAEIEHILRTTSRKEREREARAAAAAGSPRK